MYSDRLKEGIYTNNDGKQVKFLFESQKKVITKKGSKFDFANVNNSYVQDQGVTARSYPMIIYIAGVNYDQECDVFEAAIYKGGLGRLEFAYTSVDVKILGDIVREDQFVEGAQQATYKLTFYESIDQVYPISNVDLIEQVNALSAESETALAEQFTDNIDVSSLAEEETLYLRFKEYLKQVDEFFKEIAASQSEIRSMYDKYYDLVNVSISVFMNNPSLIIYNFIQLIKTPSRSGNSLGNKIEGYLNFFSSAAQDANQNINNPTLPADDQNCLALGDVVLGSCISSLTSISTVATFSSRKDAEKLSEVIAQLSDKYINDRDQWYTLTGSVDTGESQQALDGASGGSKKLLNNNLFLLPTEKIVKLEKDRTVIDLCGQYYKDVSQETVQYFIDTNNLQGDNILLLPRGKKVVLFV